MAAARASVRPGACVGDRGRSLPGPRPDSGLLRSSVGRGIRTPSAQRRRRAGAREHHRPVAEVNGHVVFGTPKSHQARWLPVPAFLPDELRQEIVGRGPDDLVFPSPQGTVLRCRTSGVVTSTGPEGSRPRRTRPARAAAHGGVARDLGGSDGQERPADARSRVGDADARPLRAHVSRTSSTRWPPDWTRRPARQVCTECVLRRTRCCSTRRCRTVKRPVDLRSCWVPPAGFEPATHGLGNRRSIP